MLQSLPFGAGRARFNTKEVDQRRVKFAAVSQSESTAATTGDVAITEASLSTLVGQLKSIIRTSNPPNLDYGDGTCPLAASSRLVSYCPTDNSLRVDLPGLQALGTPAAEANSVLAQGDNTAISLVISRYVLAQQNQNGLRLDTPATALRTACLTGVAERALSAPRQAPAGGLYLTAGKIDEAVAGLLANGLVASNVSGATVPAGFTRIAAFRLGFTAPRKALLNISGMKPIDRGQSLTRAELSYHLCKFSSVVDSGFRHARRM